MPQSHAQIWIHIIFSTKERRTFLEDSSFREEMFRMLSHHVKESKCISASIGGYIDHVHLLVGLSRTITIAQLAENVKTETSKRAKKRMGLRR
jgi:REP element-mobilizing transposase RayT